MRNFWRDLSVAKKLYAVVGLMALLIAAELLTLVFAMNTLSSVRAFVVGEGLWSKAQKDAIQSLYQYALTGEPEQYQNFNDHLSIPKGDRKARTALMRNPVDRAVVRSGFVEGGNHPEDVDGMIDLLMRFSNVSFLAAALGAWTRADGLMDQLLEIARSMDRNIRQHGPRHPSLKELLDRLTVVNARLTEEENAFSRSLGEGSRWLENLLFLVLTLTVLTVESTGLYLTFRFSSTLGASLQELTEVAREVGRGNFMARATVRSQDELGQLAESVNKMAADLKSNVGGRLQAESANEIKSIFVANTSHEIRSPLGIILGFVEILKDPELPRAERERYLGIIEQTGRNLIRVIDDILDISKIESGHLEIQLAHIDVADLVAEMAQMFEVRAQEKGNQIQFIRDPSAPRRFTTDPDRLRQIMINMIGNANKFTENGVIHIEYGGEGQTLYFRISDTGIGLDSFQATRLFQAFSQADQSTSRRFGGTGLGLVLSKRIAGILGGDVVLERSRLGVGSTFRVTVADQAEMFAKDHSMGTAKSAPVLGRNLAGRKVLIVDDSEDNLLLLETLLEKMGLLVTSVLDGRQALLQVAQDDYDLVIMDIQMPVMDGYETARGLRQKKFAGPIVALTANAMAETRERCLRAGCSDYMTKPLEMDHLREMLSRHLA